MSARRLWTLVVIVPTLVCLLAGGSVAQEAKPKYGGTLVFALASNPPGLNPNLNFATITHMVTGQVFNSLVAYDHDMNLQPELARSWTVSPDNLTITFSLEPNVRFHDGKPLTSADVKFSIEDVSRKHHPLGPKIFAYLDRIDTPDPLTAVFRLKQPYPPMLSYLAGWFASILPKHVYEGTDILNNPANMQPIGSGPFVFKEFVSGSHVTVERNPNYWRKGRPYLDRIVFKITPDEAARVIALERGELDLQNYYGFPYSALGRLRRMPGLKVELELDPFAGVLWVPINLRNPILSKVQVRQALAHAVNKEDILQKAMFGVGKVGQSPIPSNLGWAHNPKVRQYAYDPAEANRLLDQAGHPRGGDGMRFKLNIYFDGGRQAHRKAAEIMRENFRAVGIDLDLRGTEMGSMMDAIYKSWTFDLGLHEVAMGPDPAVGTARLYTTDQIVKVAFTNGMGYSNAEVDRLFAEAAQTANRKKRGELYGRIQDILVQDLPALWLVEILTPIVFRTEFVGLPAGPLHDERFDNVWWTKGK
jgi:peptide/nickel transport system substrate-binding protein